MATIALRTSRVHAARRMRTPLAFVLLLALTVARAFAAPPEKIKVLVLTGGHGFKAEPFFALFTDNPEIAFTAASHGVVPTQPASAYDRPDLFTYDVVVLYDAPSVI